MTVRIYIMGIEVIGSRRQPAHFVSRFGTGTVNAPYSFKDFGFTDTCIVVSDVTTEQHAELIGYSDVLAAPANIDNAIPNNTVRDNVRSQLEGLNVPAGWVQTGMSYREVLRPITHLFLFAQRYHALTAEKYGTGRKLVEQGYTLDTIISDIPVEVRQDLQDAADSLGYDYSSVQASDTYRVGLKKLADQWGETPVLFGTLLTL